VSNNDHSVNYNIQYVKFNFFDDNTYVRTPSQALTNRSHFEDDDRSGKCLALLSFDGGLDGDLSSLYVLKHFVERVGQAKGLKHASNPYEFFDVVGGAGIEWYVSSHTCDSADFKHWILSALIIVPINQCFVKDRLFLRIKVHLLEQCDCFSTI